MGLFSITKLIFILWEWEGIIAFFQGNGVAVVVAVVHGRQVKALVVVKQLALALEVTNVFVGNLGTQVGVGNGGVDGCLAPCRLERIEQLGRRLARGFVVKGTFGGDKIHFAELQQWHYGIAVFMAVGRKG